MFTPKIVERTEMTLVGIVGTGRSVSEIDIAGLWERFISVEPEISHKVDPETGFELHIEKEQDPKMHFTIVGIEVGELRPLPLELFAKVVPGGTYAQFTHHFKDGGFGEAFKQVYAWVEDSDYKLAYPFDIQVYDERYTSPSDPESVIEILVPVKQR